MRYFFLYKLFTIYLTDSNDLYQGMRCAFSKVLLIVLGPNLSLFWIRWCPINTLCTFTILNVHILTHSARLVVISTTGTVCLYTILYKHNLSTRKVLCLTSVKCLVYFNIFEVCFKTCLHFKNLCYIHKVKTAFCFPWKVFPVYWQIRYFKWVRHKVC